MILFDPGMHKAFHKLSLEYEKQNQEWCTDQHSGCAYIAPLHSCLIGHGKHCKTQGQWSLLYGIRHN